jgi:hypothetical protein
VLSSNKCLQAGSTGFSDDTLISVMDQDNDLFILESSESTIDYPVVPNYAFGFGEVLKFKIRYGFIKAGTAEMKVMAKIDSTQRPMYHIQSTARSISSFDWIYKVDDEVNSFVDFKGFYPLRFEKKLREGSYHADLFVDYFHKDSLAKVLFIRHKKGKEPKSFKVKIPPFAKDILSSFYYIRTQDLKVGESIYLTNHEKDKVFDLEVKVHKKETVKVDAGKFRCLVVEPMLKDSEAIFKQKGRLTIWLTDDNRKIPVLMKSKIIVGSITTELVEIDGISGVIQARLDK